MRTTDFEYDLPPSLIAQDPLPDRAGSRLLVLDRATGSIRHLRFRAIVANSRTVARIRFTGRV